MLIWAFRARFVFVYVPAHLMLQGSPSLPTHNGFSASEVQPHLQPGAQPQLGPPRLLCLSGRSLRESSSSPKHPRRPLSTLHDPTTAPIPWNWSFWPRPQLQADLPSLHSSDPQMSHVDLPQVVPEVRKGDSFPGWWFPCPLVPNSPPSCSSRHPLLDICGHASSLRSPKALVFSLTQQSGDTEEWMDG